MPIVGLDIDGVLLCRGRVEPSDIAATKYSVFSSGVVTHETVAALELLKPLVDFRWFTSWDDDVATRVFADLVDVRSSLLENIRTEDGEYGIGGNDWASIKSRGALKFGEAHPTLPLTLLDDEVRVNQANVTTVPVNPLRGLTRSDATLVLDSLNQD